jgi:hypothetical protein
LKLFISLVGTVIFGTLSVFIPVLTHTIFLVDKSYGKFRWKLIVNLFLIFLYFVILVSSTSDDVKAIIEIYQ